MTRILHVTEAMGSGVLSLVDSVSRRQAEAGADVEVLFVPRTETPDDAALRARFDDRVALRRVSTGSRLRDLRTLAAETARAAEHVDAVHAHSSIAGAVVRIALWRGIPAERVFFSPHGFAFLRLDLPAPVRHGIRMLEAVLAKRSTLVLTSPSELAVAEEALHPPRAHLVQTGVPSASVARAARAADPRRRPIVGMIGRVVHQKAPWRFAAAARALGERADFVWIGGGSADDERRWFGDSPVRVTGWVSAAELADLVDTVDVLLFPSLWEGMSLSLIQAQAHGIPAVVSDVVGNRDSVEDGVTGFVCADDGALIASTALLLDDPALRERMSAAALDWARRALIDDALGRDSLALYRLAAVREGVRAR
jgi:glycosyltransferase involved in cell wall biosynthesis